ncbi:MAG TPA: glutathione S-transferase [Candidatus Binataceae bacterium]|nr:glutathione S-transferase [Candidatus Binataceae bacterium]
MKLYNHSMAPNPRRVRMFAAEKGIKLEQEEVDIFAGHNRTPQFLAKNPSGGLPVLELDDGAHLAETVAISRYLESLYPEPNLFGRDAREQAFVEMWNRRMELELMMAIGNAFQHTSPMLKGRLQQFPEFGETRRAAAQERLARMDRELQGRQFVAGERFTIADITALVAIDFGKQLVGIQVDPALRELTRWYEAVSSRPSAKA